MTLDELRSKPVEYIASRILNSAKYDYEVNGINYNTALEMALFDYYFWYSDNEEKQATLENLVYINKDI